MHESRDLGQGQPRLGAARVEQAQFHAVGDLGEHREVDPSRVEGGAEWQRPARPDVRYDARVIAHNGTAMEMMF